jgi:hypothetical protein
LPLDQCRWQKDRQLPGCPDRLEKLRRGYVHIPQQASFFRAELWKKVGPLDDSFYFAMDYDLWTRLAAEAPLLYVPELWAAFRLHGDAKSIAEDDAAGLKCCACTTVTAGKNFR